jgi:hypothetical protein
MAVQITQRLACAVLRANMTMVQYGSMFTVRNTGASGIIKDELNKFQSCESATYGTMLSSQTAIEVMGVEAQKQSEMTLTTYKYFTGIGRSDYKQGKMNSIPEIEANCGPPGQNFTCRKEISKLYIYKRALSDFKGMFLFM